MVIHLNIIINIIFLYDFIYSDPENLVLIICFNYIGKERSKYNMLLEKERQQQEASGTYILLSSNNPEHSKKSDHYFC